MKLHNIIYESILKKIIRGAISLSGLESFYDILFRFFFVLRKFKFSLPIEIT